MEERKEKWRGKAIMGKEVDEGSVELKLKKNTGGTERLLEDCFAIRAGGTKQ